MRLIWANFIFMTVSMGLLPYSTLHSQEVLRLSQPIDWVQANNVKAQTAQKDGKALALFRSAVPDQNELDKIRLPVLVPGTGPVRAAPRLRHQGVSYVASYALAGAKVSVLGSVSALNAPAESTFAIVLANRQSESPAVFETTEDGADLSLQRYGAAYILRISCTRAADERCQWRAFLDSVAKTLIMVGGSQK